MVKREEEDAYDTHGEPTQIPDISRGQRRRIHAGLRQCRPCRRGAGPACGKSEIHHCRSCHTFGNGSVPLASGRGQGRCYFPAGSESRFLRWRRGWQWRAAWQG
ncbi:hypothetical protein [Sneathiella sp.]|uniref:hypothetical protein n=1 Tax=Sneathiella sp. TaxID=1964365 RepID=UPI003458C771